MRLTNLKTKENVLTAARRTKADGLYVKEDYSEETRQIRKELLVVESMKQKKALDLYAFLCDRKLVVRSVDGKERWHEQRKGKTVLTKNGFTESETNKTLKEYGCGRLQEQTHSHSYFSFISCNHDGFVRFHGCEDILNTLAVFDLIAIYEPWCETPEMLNNVFTGYECLCLKAKYDSIHGRASGGVVVYIKDEFESRGPSYRC